MSVQRLSGVKINVHADESTKTLMHFQDGPEFFPKVTGILFGVKVTRNLVGLNPVDCHVGFYVVQ